MYKIIEITQYQNIEYLKKFLMNKLPKTFRYFNSRSIDVIKNHIITIILLFNDEPVGYAHIDYEYINDKYWFGICILPEHQCKGNGTYVLNYLFNSEKKYNFEDIYLSVDNQNANAIHLYSKYNFEKIDVIKDIFIMKKNIK